MALDRLCEGRDDYRRFRRHRGTPRYRVRLGWCKNLWIGAGLAMLFNPALTFVGPLALALTCLSFALLDESDSDD
jgi:hypothetical protein